MKCHYHEREATGQCKHCNCFVCSECLNQNVGMCRHCAEKIRREEIIKKRSSAKTDILLFLVVGTIATAIFALGVFPSGISGTITSLYFGCNLGAGALGVKKLGGFIWKHFILISLLLLVLVFFAGLVVGPVIAPYRLYKAYKTLRETPEPAEYIPPPPPSIAPMTNTAKPNYCPHCGTVVNPEANFCKACGKQI